MKNDSPQIGWRKALRYSIPYVILSSGVLIMAAPFFWLIATSFKLPAEVIRYPPTWFPAEPTLKSYQRLFEVLPIGRLYLNSLIIAISVTILVLFTSSIVGYVFAKFEFRGRQPIFIMILSVMMIPFQVIMIPTYLMMVYFKWLNTYWAIIVPAAFSSFGIFLLRQWLHSVPNELLDAARIDGSSEFGIFFRVVLPLCKPALGTLGIFTFIGQWDDFLWPLIVLNSSEKWTLPIGIVSFANRWWTDYSLTMAGATISVIPVLIVYLLLQRQITQGIALTGLKM